LKNGEKKNRKLDDEKFASKGKEKKNQIEIYCQVVRATPRGGWGEEKKGGDLVPPYNSIERRSQASSRKTQ